MTEIPCPTCGKSQILATGIDYFCEECPVDLSELKTRPQPDTVAISRESLERVIEKLKWYSGEGESGKFKIVDSDGSHVADFVLFADRAKDCLSILEAALGEKS